MTKAEASRLLRRTKQQVCSGLLRGLFGVASVMAEEIPKEVYGNSEESAALVTCRHSEWRWVKCGTFNAADNGGRKPQPNMRPTSFSINCKL